MANERRVALVNEASAYVGPPLALELARRGHDLVLANPREGLVAELEALGAAVEVAQGSSNLAEAGVAEALVDTALARFGRIDAAVAFTGQIIPVRFLDSTDEQFDRLVDGCLRAPHRFLRAVARPMVERGEGQVLLITSASGSKPTKDAPIYSSVRAGANMLARNLAAEVAPSGVQVNAVGTNFMDFPEFHAASGTNDPERRAKLESRIPLRRMGQLDEFARFCMAFLDGGSTFATGQVVNFAGGWV